MTLVYRSTVGRRLTVSEGDGNISDLSASIGGLVIGTDVQAWDADLTAIAALSSADSNFIVGSAGGWVAESGATARTSLGASASGDTVFTGTAAAGFGALKQDATTAATGVVELATQAEMDAGTAGKVPTTDLNKIAIGTPVATTSGTAFDFTVPAGTREVGISFRGNSLSGTDHILVQLGDVGGIKTTDYVSTSVSAEGAGASVSAESTSGFIVRIGGATGLLSGHMTLLLHDSSAFAWTSSHLGKIATTFNVAGGGDKALSAELTTVRITRNGTDTFDLGSVNVHCKR